jgi:hypothetical protein
VRTCDDQGCPGIRPAPRRSSSGGHEYVTCAAQAAGTAFVKEGNRFTAVADPAGLAQVADTLVAVRDRRAPEPRLSQVCARWIYTACLSFGLHLGRATAQRVRLLLFHPPGRVQPQPAVHGRRPDGPGIRQHRQPDPIPTGRAHPAHLVRRQTPPQPQAAPVNPRLDLQP